MTTNFKLLAIAGLLASLGASAVAADYFFVQPKPWGMATVAPYSVSLASAMLPQAKVGTVYSLTGYDFASKLTVSGDPNFNASLATYALSSGNMPSGMTLSTTGKFTGTPSAASAGTTLQVAATYKSIIGTQSYNWISVAESATSGLLMHFDGALTDSGSSNRGLAVMGSSPTLTTVDKAVGAGSAILNGVSYLCASPFNFLEPVTGNFTIELWAKPTGAGDMALVSQHTYGSALGFFIYRSAAGEIRVHESPSSTLVAVTGINVMPLNVWTHMAWVRYGASTTMYVNGVSAATTTTSNSGYYNGNSGYGGVALGGGACNTNWYGFKGMLDEIRISSTARYTGSFTPSTALLN